MFLSNIRSSIEMRVRLDMIRVQPQNNDVRYSMAIRFSPNAHLYRCKDITDI